MNRKCVTSTFIVTEKPGSRSGTEVKYWIRIRTEANADPIH